MKKLLQTSRYLPKFKPGQVVSFVMNQGSPQRISPTLASEVRCPMCLGNEGLPIPNGGEVWWSCSSSECLQLNAKKAPIRKKNVVTHQKLLERAGAPVILQTASFDNWFHGDKIKDSMLNWLKNPTGFCVLSGEKGRGKSFVSCCAIAHYTRFKGRTALFMDVVESKYAWLDEMRSDGRNMLSSKMTQCDLLVIDDIDKVNPSDAFYEFLYFVVNSRYTSMKPTVVTSNKNFEDLGVHLGEAIGSRIFEKKGLFIEVSGTDLRE